MLEYLELGTLKMRHDYMTSKRIALVVAAVTLSLETTALSQQEEPRVRRVPSAVQETSSTPRVRRVPTPPTSSQRTGTETRGLKDNHSIRLHGMLGTGESIDMTLLGIGPVFSADQLVGDDDTVVACRYTVVENESGGFRMDYRISCRIRIKTSARGDTFNYEYRDVTIEGSTMCQADKPVAILKNGENSLNLTLAKAADPTAE